MRRLLATAIVALLASFHVAAAGDDLGPATGTKAPDIGTPLDQSGKPRSLASLMGDKGMVFFFFRSAAWCPYCQAQLIELNSGVGDMEKRGYHLARPVLRHARRPRNLQHQARAHLHAAVGSEVGGHRPVRSARSAIRGRQQGVRCAAADHFRRRPRRRHQGQAVRGDVQDAAAPQSRARDARQARRCSGRRELGRDDLRLP